MTLNILGTPKPGNYDPTLVDRLNKQAAEEAERLRKQTDTERQPSAAKAPREDKQHTNQPMLPAEYAGLCFECPAIPLSLEDKGRFTFEDSLHRLRNAGFGRHPAASETLGLIAAGLEGKLASQAIPLYHDVINCSDEWLSLAVRSSSKYLYCYEHPEGIVWNGEDYDTSKLSFSKKRAFPLKGLKTNEWLHITKIAAHSNDLITYLFSRPFDQLPCELQERVTIYIPLRHQTIPFALHVQESWGDEHTYSIGGGPLSGSRGVKVNL